MLAQNIELYGDLPSLTEYPFHLPRQHTPNNLATIIQDLESETLTQKPGETCSGSHPQTPCSPCKIFSPRAFNSGNIFSCSFLILSYSFMYFLKVRPWNLLPGAGPHIRNSTIDFLVSTKDAREEGIEVRVQDNSVWLTQKAIGQLFDVDRSVVTKHLKRAFESGELDESTTCTFFA